VNTVGGSGSVGEGDSVGGGDRWVVEAESDRVETTHKWRRSVRGRARGRRWHDAWSRRSEHGVQERRRHTAQHAEVAAWGRAMEEEEVMGVER
jgi:hypothetical protein